MTDKFRNIIHNLDYALLLAMLIPLIGILPTFGEGLANGADAPFHAHRIYALAELIQDGNLYPRWVNYFHMGYGYPIFNYYAPGATHIGAWFRLIGFDVVTAYNLTNALAWVIGSVGVYLLARTFLPIRVALVACVLWVYAPSRLYEFWWQGSLAQIVATAFIPYVFYGIVRTTRVPSLRNSLWIAIPFALIVLSHTPTTYMTALFVAPFCVVAPLPLKSRREILRRWLYIGAGLGISAGFSAIFLIPVFAEVQYVRIAGELPDTIAFLRERFGTFSEVFSLPMRIDSTDYTLVMPRTLGLVGGVLSVVGCVALLFRRKFLLTIVLVLGLGFAIFLALEPSLDVWLLIPGFRNLRFPERILRVGTVFVALLGASSLLMIPRRWHLMGGVMLSAVVIAQALPIMHPRDDDRVWENLSALDEIEMEARDNNWGTTAYDEYEPVWGEVTKLDFPPDAESYIEYPFRIRLLESDYLQVADELQYDHLTDNTIRVTVAGDNLQMRFRQFYFPGWQVTLDGEPFPIEIDERFGLIQLSLPQGEHVLQFVYVGTPVQHVSALISVLTVIGCAVLIWRTPKHPNANPVVSEQPLHQKTFVILASGVILFAVVNVVWLQDKFRITSPPDDPYYMQQSVNQTFGDTVTLLGYTLESNRVSPEDSLEIRLFWRVDEATENKYRPVIQLVDLNVSESWAVSQPLDFEGGKISELTPDVFMSDGHTLELFEDVPPYVGQVMIQLLDRTNSAAGVPATVDEGQDRIILPELIRIDVPSESYDGDVADIQFADMLTLACVGLTHDEANYTLDMWWQVNKSIPADYKLFVHGLDASGEIVQQTDRFPLDGLYPMSLWQVGQMLNDRVLLPHDDDIVQIRLGLYNPADETRLPVTVDGRQSDHINLSVEETSCPA